MRPVRLLWSIFKLIFLAFTQMLRVVWCHSEVVVLLCGISGKGGIFWLISQFWSFQRLACPSLLNRSFQHGFTSSQVIRIWWVPMVYPLLGCRSSLMLYLFELPQICQWQMTLAVWASAWASFALPTNPTTNYRYVPVHLSFSLIFSTTIVFLLVIIVRRVSCVLLLPPVVIISILICLPFVVRFVSWGVIFAPPMLIGITRRCTLIASLFDYVQLICCGLCVGVKGRLAVILLIRLWTGNTSPHLVLFLNFLTRLQPFVALLMELVSVARFLPTLQKHHLFG